MIPVILSGGSGTRLWPLSREAYPKQLLALVGEESLLQATWRRVAPLASLPPIVIANEEHRFMVAEQLREVGCQSATILLESVGRNTAPAIAIAALEAMRSGTDPLLLVLPSDHVISNEQAFQEAVNRAQSAAKDGALVTFGIVPNHAATGYGYIRATPGDGIQKVELFVEKPDTHTAASYIATGRYYWNSGMFLFRASRFLTELERHAPTILYSCRQALSAARRDEDFVRLEKTAFEACPSDSIDYAVMEKTDAAAVLGIDVGWSDVGSWSTLWEISSRDESGNACHGNVVQQNCENTLAWGQDRLVALLGLKDAVVVDTSDALLVAHKDHVQDIKKIVSQLKIDGHQESLRHRKVHRPWGFFDTVDFGEHFQVKRITVKPGAALSLQMHHHRAEHWVVVSGTARVTRGDEIILLSKNQSTYIPLGIKHRLENPGHIPLQIIEVQSGDYLGEDDIVRFDDHYGRG